MIKKIFAITIFSIVCVAIVSGKTSKNETKQYQKQKYVEKIENFFNNIKTFSADFIEINRTGKQSIGTFLLKRRPTKLKMDYKTPPTKAITVKDNKAVYYDKELKEKTKSSIYSSPLAFLLDTKVDLHKNIEVISYIEKKDTLIIVFRKKDDIDDEYGAVAMIFSLKPFMLVRWEIYRSSNQIDIEIPILVYLQNQKINQNISDKEFDEYE